MIYSLVISFTNYNLATDTARNVGTSNYSALFSDPLVRESLQNTLVLRADGRAAGDRLRAVPRDAAQPRQSWRRLLPDGVLPAEDDARRWRRRRCSCCCSTATPAPSTRRCGAIGIHGPQWLVDPTWVKPSIVIITLWGVSGTMVIFLAALKNVPRDLYEVASLDGAGPVRQFFSITLPMISGALFFNTIVLTIAAFQVFDQAYLLFWRDQSNSSPEQAAVLRRLPVPAGLPAVQLRFRRGDGLGAVRDPRCC